MAVAAVRAACGSDNVRFKVSSRVQPPTAQPEPGKALVYVVEQFEPGEHHLCTDWQSVRPWLHVQPSLARLTAGNAGYFALDLETVNPGEGRMLVASGPLSSYRPKK